MFAVRNTQPNNINIHHVRARVWVRREMLLMTTAKRARIFSSAELGGDSGKSVLKTFSVFSSIFRQFLELLGCGLSRVIHLAENEAIRTRLALI